MIVACAVEKHANEIDLQLTKIESSTFQCFSFKHSVPEERIATMHANKLINVKARHETLCEVNTNMKAKVQGETKSIGIIRKEANHNGSPLFLTVESNCKDIHAVTNPYVCFKASQWLQHNHPTVQITEDCTN